MPISVIKVNRTHVPVITEAIDVSLDVSSIVLTTLRDACRITPLPLLSTAAGIAVDIIVTVQKARQNKDGFKRLADDACELVYVIILAHKDISNEPDDLTRNLQQLIDTLTSIQKFAERSASRNYLQSMFRLGMDAKKIQDYREKLQQSMRVFGLQSDISLRQTVAELASRQIEMMDELKNRAPLDPIIPSESVDLAPWPTGPSFEAGVKTDAVMRSILLSTENVATIGIIFVGIAISLYIGRIQNR